ncbi:hypothetical protein E2C01_068875 [Portunus trituberculatus]|uniref:Uncharacterized protein n=1 Tax=Portunus trituberculatus TaxID=210409 RepID=A0A5B7HXE6_PORTR|nr:hypothetical protein [Portunus trituberculatus]
MLTELTFKSLINVTTRPLRLPLSQRRALNHRAARGGVLSRSYSGDTQALSGRVFGEYVSA